MVKIGFEVHQQLATRKLFCPCPSEISDEKEEFTVYRKLRPTQSELGEVDRAAMEEFLKGKGFAYKVNSKNTCLVELDEEPPHEVNEEAVKIAVEIALMFNASVVDEIHFMRKLVIDGSNTSGFQRTAIVALDGFLETSEGRVRIPTICLEEEAARLVGSENEKTVVYNLDRLGIPLIEITTAPDINSSAQAREVALKIGEILRATKKVKRGIGTIRQDTNISLEGGKRVEIKGVQELNLIPKLIENEIKRQKELEEVKKELEKRGVKEVKYEVSGREIRLKRFSGLVESRALGKELAEYAKVKAGVKEIAFKDSDDDAVIVIPESEDKQKTIDTILERARLAIDGVPEETRVARGEETAYMRPLPGAARMYPETDILPHAVSRGLIKELSSRLAESYEEAIKRIAAKYNLSSELASQIVKEEHLETFEELAKTGAQASIVAKILLSTLKELKKEGQKTEKIKLEDLKAIFSSLAKKEISKESIPELLRSICEGKTAGEALKKGEKLSEKEIEKLVDALLEEKKDFIALKKIQASTALMGVLMKELRGKADGITINRILTKKLEEKIKGYNK